MSFSQYILDSQEHFRRELRLRNLWMIRWRWVYLLVLSGLAFVLTFLTEGNGSIRSLLGGLCLSGILVNIALFIWANEKRLSKNSYYAIAFCQILLDALLAAAVVLFIDGFESRATILFAIPILAAGMLFMPLLAYIATAVSSLLYIAAMIGHERLIFTIEGQKGILFPAVFYTIVFLLLALIVSGYSARTAAKERETSYAELLSLLRHQLHHPSGVIAAIIDMLEQGNTYQKLSPKEQGYVRQLRYENQRMHTMITNVLKTAEASEGATDTTKWKDVHLISLISTRATAVASSFKRLEDLKDELPNDDILVYGNAEQLQIAFENIIENAFKYSDKGHSVILRFKTGKAPAIEIDIEDHGQGISEKDQKRLFKAFGDLEKPSTDSHSAINSYSMGLGLYISKMIIEQHGGELQLQSKVGQGTKVIIRLRQDMWRKLYGKK